MESRRGLGVAVMFSFAAFAACAQPAIEARQSPADPQGPPPTPSTPTTMPTTPPSAPTPTPTPTPTSPTAQPAPRLIAPLSTSISMSMSPIFTWVPEGATASATVDVCRDRACQNVIVSFAAAGASAQPPQPLPAGVVFWRVSSATPGGRTSAVWELTIPVRDSGRQGSWGSVPDFNGDGFGDLAVGVQATGSAPLMNSLRFFPGGPQGPATTPAQTFSGSGGFANEAGSAGDLDGDGFADLAVWNGPNGGLGQPQAVTVTVYRGGPSGLSSPVTFAGPDAVFGNQMRVLGAGDVNGDGYGDLLVGGASVAELFLGGPTGVSPTPAEMLPPPAVPAGFSPDARWPIGNGDFNGDGHPDAIILGLNGGLLYEGDGQTLVAHPEVSIPSSFGALAGDYNGDGFADLALFDILTGGPNGLTQFNGVAGEDFYQGVGDVNGDGFSDVLTNVSSLVGVPEADRLYFGSQTACGSTSCTNFAPLLVPGRFNPPPGFAPEVAGAKGLGDVNGDGFDDFVFFEPGAGAVYLFFGSPAGPPSNPSMTITAEQGFGFAVAGL